MTLFFPFFKNLKYIQKYRLSQVLQNPPSKHTLKENTFGNKSIFSLSLLHTDAMCMFGFPMSSTKSEWHSGFVAAPNSSFTKTTMTHGNFVKVTVNPNTHLAIDPQKINIFDPICFQFYLSTKYVASYSYT